MKKVLKVSIAFVASVLMISTNYTSVIAADNNNHFYDVKKAGDYVLAFCGANVEGCSMPETRECRINEVFSYDPNIDCTNFMSQTLYYGGYKMEGSPYITMGLRRMLGHSLGCDDDDEWFYYKFKGNFDVKYDCWSSTWKNVEGKTEAGLYNYLTRKRRFNEPFCHYKPDLEYCDDFAEKYNVNRGDIIQIDFDGKGGYDHSTFVWCTNPEIRLCYHSIFVWAKPLREIDEGLRRGGDTPKYRIIYATEHAKANTSIW